MMCWRFLYPVFLCGLCLNGLVALAPLLQGPVFIQEPSATFDFSNSTGALLGCSAHGSPPPDIAWLDAAGHEVPGVSRLRTVLNNGSLYFPPFPPEDYSPEVHAAAYRCRASNPVGSIVSRECRLRADVSQAYQLQVHNVFVVRGNVAVLRCTVPSFVRGLVFVSAWMRDDPLLGRSPIHPGSRFTVTTGGALHVRDAQPEDGYARFVCQAVHKLTGERRLSLPGQLVVTEPEGNSAPRIEHSAPSLHVQNGAAVDLACVARGYPPPSYRWYREEGGALQEVNPSSPHARPLHSVLQLPMAQPGDSGRYVCVTHNPLGEDRREVTLTVSSPLNVYIRPQQQTVDAGAVATLNCSVSGGGEVVGLRDVTWLKDGRSVVSGGRISITEGGRLLTVHGVSRVDRGMYQCLVRSGEDNAQGSAELSLGAVAPELHSTFITQTLQPGPSVSLRCTASGSPPPRVSWLLDGAELGGSAGLVLGSFLASGGDVVSHLNVTSVRVHHGGLYTCVATNSAGSAAYSAPLNVYGPPSARPPRNLTVVAGTDVFLRCPVAGFPISSVTWRRGEVPLPSHTRQRVFPNGTLVVRGVEGGADSGQYSCVASNTQGQSAQSILGIDVMKPPEIAPFQFPTNLREGMRAQVSCSIISGDFPIAISWRKDGGLLVPEPDVAEQQHQFVSNLLFMNLAARHSGQYTCIASNAAATANYTARLVVRVAPTWEIEPKDTSVLYQRGVSLDCQASGFPQPTATWLRARVGGSQAEDFSPLLPGPRLFLASNGSVVIHAADSSHQGQYMCQASNGIGSGLSKSIFLRVNVPAHFAMRTSNQSAVAGEAAVLSCPAQGDAPLRVSWVSGPQVRSLSTAQVREVATAGGGVSAELHLAALTRRDAGAYRCMASNEFGEDEMLVHLHVKEPPEAPSRVSLMETGSRSLTLSWSAPYSGHAAISHYVVQYREQLATLPASNVVPSSPESAWHNVTAGGGARSARIAALRPATAYLLRVVAVNEVGAGPASHPPLLAVTTQEAPSGPPVDVTADASSPEILHVRWKPPLQGFSHGEILGYQVAYREVGGSEATQQTRRVRGRNRLDVSLTGLRQFTRYQLTVRAFNRVGLGPSSSPLVVTTLQGVPDAPPINVRCSALSSQSLRVRWDPPPVERRNGIVEGYKVFYQLVSSANSAGSSTDVEVKKTTNLETNLHGLTHYANYSLRVAAFTAAGDGERSSPIHCTTEEDVPGPPEHVKALVSTSESVLVTWTRPSNPNGQIVKYHVYITALAQVSPKEVVKEVVFGDRELMYEARRLKEFSRYEFYVTACTSVGEGQPSPKVSQSPISRVPARIASFTRRFVVAAGQALSLPCLAVGMPAPERSWRALGRTVTSSDSPGLRALPDGSLSLAAVRSGDHGNYTCLAENVYGRDEIHYELAVQLPPGAPLLSMLGTASHALTLQWRLPDDGGSPVTGFWLSYRREGGEWQQMTLDPDRRSVQLDRLACGTPYVLQIAAGNAVGRGKPGPALSVATKGSAPRVPTQDEFLEVNSTCATLFLDAWPAGGCPLTHFSVEVREARAAAAWELVSSRVPPSQPELTLRDLQPARWYAVRVSAHSDAGAATHEFLFATRNEAGEMVLPEMEPERPGPQQGVSFTDPTVVVPILSGMICTAAAAVCVCIVLRRRQYQGYQQSSSSSASVATEQNRYSGKASLMEAENRRNSDQQQQHRTGGGNNHHSNQLYSPSPARKQGADSSLSCQKGSDTTSAQDYEICPYATFSLNPAAATTNGNTGGQQTMDYSMQFQTFSQQECYAGQPQAPTLPSSGATPGYNPKPGSSKEYYSRVRRKSNGSRLTAASPAASEATSSFSVAKRTSKSPPDGLSLEISCISSQQTLPMSGPTGIQNSGGGGRNARHRPHSSPPPSSRPRSCPMGDGADSDSSNSRKNGGNYSSRPPYHLPSQNKHGHSSKGTKDLQQFDPDSSTESAEASPEVTHRSRRKGAPPSGPRRPICSGSSQDGLAALQPPTGFSDPQELSEAECDRAERRAHRNGVEPPVQGLPLFRHEQLEQELASLVKRYRQERDREKQDYTIHV